MFRRARGKERYYWVVARRTQSWLFWRNEGGRFQPWVGNWGSRRKFRHHSNEHIRPSLDRLPVCERINYRLYRDYYAWSLL